MARDGKFGRDACINLTTSLIYYPKLKFCLDSSLIEHPKPKFLCPANSSQIFFLCLKYIKAACFGPFLGPYETSMCSS